TIGDDHRTLRLKARLILRSLAAQQGSLALHEGPDAVGDPANLGTMPLLVMRHQPLLGLQFGNGRGDTHQARIAVSDKTREDREAGARRDKFADTVDIVAAHADAVA